jgi:cobalt-zinc-cadmium efflux system protein
VLTAAYTVVQFAGAWFTDSLALLADAAHMLTDVGGLGLALLAIRFAARPATPAKSYGYYRTEILAALVNGAVLFAVGGYVLYEAVARLRNPPDVSGGGMIAIASVGLLVNVVGMLLLRSGSAESLNVEGAFLEVVADLLGSLGVIVAGIIIEATGWWYADPLFSVGIGLFIIPRTLRLMRSAANILMEGAPEGLDVAAVEATIAGDPEVRGVHDLHVWGITSGIPALSAHVFVRPGANSDDVLARVNDQLAERFDIHHTTLQIEQAPRSENVYHEVGRHEEVGR